MKAKKIKWISIAACVALLVTSVAVSGATLTPEKATEFARVQTIASFDNNDDVSKLVSTYAAGGQATIELSDAYSPDKSSSIQLTYGERGTSSNNQITYIKPENNSLAGGEGLGLWFYNPGAETITNRQLSVFTSGTSNNYRWVWGQKDTDATYWLVDDATGAVTPVTTKSGTSVGLYFNIPAGFKGYIYFSFEDFFPYGSTAGDLNLDTPITNVSFSGIVDNYNGTTLYIDDVHTWKFEPAAEDPEPTPSDSPYDRVQTIASFDNDTDVSKLVSLWASGAAAEIGLSGDHSPDGSSAFWIKYGEPNGTQPNQITYIKPENNSLAGGEGLAFWFYNPNAEDITNRQISVFTSGTSNNYRWVWGQKDTDATYWLVDDATGAVTPVTTKSGTSVGLYFTIPAGFKGYIYFSFEDFFPYSGTTGDLDPDTPITNVSFSGHVTNIKDFTLYIDDVHTWKANDGSEDPEPTESAFPRLRTVASFNNSTNLADLVTVWKDGANAELTLSNDHSPDGSAALQITYGDLNGTQTNQINYIKTENKDFSGGEGLGFWFYNPGDKDITNRQISVSTTSTANSNRWKWGEGGTEVTYWLVDDATGAVTPVTTTGGAPSGSYFNIPAGFRGYIYFSFEDFTPYSGNTQGELDPANAAGFSYVFLSGVVSNLKDATFYVDDIHLWKANDGSEDPEPSESPFPRIKPVVSFNNSTNLADLVTVWTGGANAELRLSSDHSPDGSAALQITYGDLNGTQTNQINYIKTENKDFTGGEGLGFWFYNPGDKDITNRQISVSTTSTVNSNRWKWGEGGTEVTYWLVDDATKAVTPVTTTGGAPSGSYFNIPAGFRGYIYFSFEDFTPYSGNTQGDLDPANADGFSYVFLSGVVSNLKDATFYVDDIHLWGTSSEDPDPDKPDPDDPTPDPLPEPPDFTRAKTVASFDNSLLISDLLTTYANGGKASFSLSTRYSPDDSVALHVTYGEPGASPNQISYIKTENSNFEGGKGLGVWFYNPGDKDITNRQISVSTTSTANANRWRWGENGVEAIYWLVDDETQTATPVKTSSGATTGLYFTIPAGFRGYIYFSFEDFFPYTPDNTQGDLDPANPDGFSYVYLSGQVTNYEGYSFYMDDIHLWGTPVGSEEPTGPEIGGKFATEVRNLMAKHPAAENQNKVVLLGSSQMARWSPRSIDDFAPLDTVNIGIGNTEFEDWIDLIDNFVAPYNPTAIVIYLGSNNLGYGNSGRYAGQLGSTFLSKLRETLPECKLYYISIYPTPSRTHISDQEHICNEVIRDYCDANDDMTFIDVRNGFYKGKELNPDFYVEDNLHMTDLAYDMLAANVVPYVLKGQGLDADIPHLEDVFEDYIIK